MSDKFKVIGIPTWKNTIHNNAGHYEHIGNFARVAYDLGYPYICWNDRIYAISMDNDSGCLLHRDTNLTIEYVNHY